MAKPATTATAPATAAPTPNPAPAATAAPSNATAPAPAAAKAAAPKVGHKKWIVREGASATGEIYGVFDTEVEAANMVADNRKSGLGLSTARQEPYVDGMVSVEPEADADKKP